MLVHLKPKLSQRVLHGDSVSHPGDAQFCEVRSVAAHQTLAVDAELQKTRLVLDHSHRVEPVAHVRAAPQWQVLVTEIPSAAGGFCKV